MNIHALESSISNIELLDALGKNICKKEIILQEGNNVVVFSKKDISKGIYFVKIQNEYKNITEKIFLR